jgi:hypothetical protein
MTSGSLPSENVLELDPNEAKRALMEELNLTEEQAMGVIRQGYISFSAPGVAERMAPDDPIGQYRLKHGPPSGIERP